MKWKPWSAPASKVNVKGQPPLFLDAKATTHSEEIEVPLAVTITVKDSDVVHIVLLLPPA